MEQLLTTIFSESGLFAAIAVGLIIYESRTNQSREIRYIETINNITTNVADKINHIEENLNTLIKEKNKNE